eukprot:6089449-Pleurochrysis_carterae.AAC.2
MLRSRPQTPLSLQPLPPPHPPLRCRCRRVRSVEAGLLRLNRRGYQRGDPFEINLFGSYAPSNPSRLSTTTFALPSSSNQTKHCIHKVGVLHGAESVC